MDDILKIFSTEDKEELKQAFKNIVIEQFRNDLENNDRYLFDPNEISNLIGEIFDDLKEELMNEYRAKMKNLMENKFRKYMEEC